MSKPKVALIIPAYKQTSIRCRSSIYQAWNFAEDAGITMLAEPDFRGGALAHTARNQGIARLLKSDSNFTHILFVDDDMLIDKDTVPKLLGHNVDLVGGLYVRRGDPPFPVAWTENAKEGEFQQLWRWDSRMVKVAGMGAGCLLVSRRVIERVATFWTECRYETRAFRMTIPEAICLARRAAYEETKEAFWFEFLPSLDAGTQIGEDLSFCLKARMAGFDCWLDTECCPGHEGAYVFGKHDFEFWRDKVYKEPVA